jgi:Flp pilus assembly protein TadD
MNYSFIRKYVTRPSFALVFIAIVLVAGVIYSNIYHYPFVFDDKPQIVEKVIIRDLANYLSFEAFLKPRPIVDLTFALNYRFGQLAVFGYHLVNVLIHIINGFLVYFLALTIFKQLLSGSTQRFGGSSKLKGGSSKVKAERGKVKAQKSKDNTKHKTSNILLSDGSAAYTGFQSSNPPVNFSPSHLLNFSSSSPPHPFTLSPFQQISFMSLFAALIFIAHPIQTQAVTYTVQRYASLAAMFYMGSVLFYLKARIVAQSSKVKAQSSELARRQSGGVGGAFSLQPSAFYLLCIICGMLAFLSKQSTASLPAAIILVEYLFIDRTWQGWKKKIVWFTPAFIVFAIFVLYVCGFFSGGHEGRGLLEDVSDLMRETKLVSRWSYLCTQFNVLVIYIRLLFLPIGQNLDYIYPFKSGFFDAYTPLAFMFLAGLTAFGIWNIKKQPIITFGIFWFFITLSVESSIFPISDALFEHRLYLPMFGFALMVTYLLFHLLSKRQLWAVVISVSIIVSLGTATYLRNGVWENGVTLWSDVVSKSPMNYRAHNNLGSILSEQGKLSEAICHFSEALRIKPDHLKARSNMGNTLALQGEYDKAIVCFYDVLSVKPDDAKAHYNLATALGHQGRVDDAIGHFRSAVKIKPRFEEARINLGIALMRQGKLKEASACFSRVLKFNPDSTVAHTYLGTALARQGKLNEATGQFREALRIDPNNVKALTNLGTALWQQGYVDEAVARFQEALRIRPDSMVARRNLAILLQSRSRTPSGWGPRIR